MVPVEVPVACQDLQFLDHVRGIDLGDQKPAIVSASRSERPSEEPLDHPAIRRMGQPDPARRADEGRRLLQRAFAGLQLRKNVGRQIVSSADAVDARELVADAPFGREHALYFAVFVGRDGQAGNVHRHAAGELPFIRVDEVHDEVRSVFQDLHRLAEERRVLPKDRLTWNHPRSQLGVFGGAASRRHYNDGSQQRCHERQRNPIFHILG